MIAPALSLDFTAAVLDPRVTFTRAGATATRVNSAGVIETVAADAPRFDFDPATLVCRGLLIEQTRTNGIRNNTMVGAVAGTPGTLPTNWSLDGVGGVSREVVGTGTENGVEYVDVRYFGTPSANGTVSLSIDAQVAASVGQAWTSSIWLKHLTGWWATNDCKARLDSGAVVTDTSATIPTVTQARLGSDGTNYLNGHLASISYYDTFSGQIYTRRKNKAVFSLL